MTATTLWYDGPNQPQVPQASTLPLFFRVAGEGILGCHQDLNPCCCLSTWELIITPQECWPLRLGIARGIRAQTRLAGCNLHKFCRVCCNFHTETFTTPTQNPEA